MIENIEITKQDVANRAHELYVQRGSGPGKDVEDWVRAEDELSSEVFVLEGSVKTNVAAADTTQKITLIADIPSSGSRADFNSKLLSPAQSTSQTYSWPLAQGVSAEVSIAGADVLPEYFDALRQYLALAEKLITPGFLEADKIKYVDAYTGETRYGAIERMYGSNAVIHTITNEEAGPNPKKFTP
jgi:hypothetical protein